jgi:hypothetical protein
MAKRVSSMRQKLGSRLESLKPNDGADTKSLEPFGSIGADGAKESTGFNQRGLQQTKRPNPKAEAGGVGEAQAAAPGAETGSDVATDMAITRGGGFSNQRQHDGFERGREVYEAYLKGNVEQDAERFKELVAGGAVDRFDPDLSPEAAEPLGQLHCAAHLIRLYDYWTLADVGREGSIEKASSWLAGFGRAESVRKVLFELESKPIRDIYPLELMLRILERTPDKLPGVTKGSLLGGLSALQEGKVFPGHPVQLPVPPSTRLKSFALLGGERPGYEFFPSKKDGYYTLQIDTPGEWQCALFAVRTESIGRMDRELPGGVLELFSVHVVEMGRKPSLEAHHM